MGNPATGHKHSQSRPHSPLWALITRESRDKSRATVRVCNCGMRTSGVNRRTERRDSRERPALKVESSLVAQRSGADPADALEAIPGFCDLRRTKVGRYCAAILATVLRACDSA